MKRDKNKPVAMAAAANGLERTRSLDDPRHFLDRILDTPQLAHVVSRLPPELLHRIIQRCGLEECGELVALATPGQLARVLDLDLWRAGQPGVDERFDAERFGVWLEVLVESGAAIAAQKLAEMDVDVVVAGLAHHARVFDRAAVTAYTTLDGDEIAPIRDPGDGVVCDVGGYTLVARRTTSWDAIVAALMALGAEHHDCFDEVMRGCVAQSNSAPEIDGLDDLLDDGEQLMFDVAFDRERRRERHGYVTPPQARAFLQMARQLRLDHATRPPVNPIASAYLGGIDRTIAEETTDASIQTP
ncbi:MAG TPA: DUF6178 family protein, partial [Vicinamibacterales bacterium]|nr:DUF6178 family protein [Vicinamibacterales bacterium]